MAKATITITGLITSTSKTAAATALAAAVPCPIQPHSHCSQLAASSQACTLAAAASHQNTPTSAAMPATSSRGNKDQAITRPRRQSVTARHSASKIMCMLPSIAAPTCPAQGQWHAGPCTPQAHQKAELLALINTGLQILFGLKAPDDARRLLLFIDFGNKKRSPRGSLCRRARCLTASTCPSASRATGCRSLRRAGGSRGWWAGLPPNSRRGRSTHPWSRSRRYAAR
ncbi:Uncharacterised protein [Comamonas aquatica]|uniref:Uncharacterized protein n=1 Tax=Comamonas aquatica TaxID=225991 RepID=A0AA35D583_9BURK|nr:Uncharacterised protein [Comamonas aquatica]CAB5692339.1 Uncharacterised protein [Comamonas aquatica]